MATIRLRGKKYQVQVRRRGSPTLSRSFTIKRDAEAWAREMEVKVDRGEIELESKILDEITLGDIVKRYRNEVTIKKRGWSQETFRLNAFLRNTICKKTLSKLTAVDFARYRDERLTMIKPKSLKTELSPIHNLFEIARDEWGIPLKQNPLDKVRIRCVDNRRQRRLKDGELERILYEAGKRENPYVVPIILFAIETSLRRGEMLSLIWGDVDWERRLVLLAESKNGHSRTIPLTPKALEVLASVRRQACSSRYGSTEPLCEVAQVCEATHEAFNWGNPDEGTQKGISNEREGGRWGGSCSTEGAEVIEDTTGGNPSAISNGEGAPGGGEPRCFHPSKPKVSQEPNPPGIQKGISNGGMCTLSSPPSSLPHSVRLSVRFDDIPQGLITPLTRESPRHDQGKPKKPPSDTNNPTLPREIPEDSQCIFPISANAFRLNWERSKKAAQVEDLHFHDLRHEAISRLFEMGLTVPEVALISGHRDARMLLRYAHAQISLIHKKLGN